MPPLLSLEVAVDFSTEELLKAGAREVLKAVRPAWDQEKVSWRVYTDGITNKLIGGRLEGETVLVRVYGEGTEKIIDRAAEMSNMQRMQEIKCGGELYCSFRNGLCYEFLPGQVLSQARLWEEAVWRGVAGRMARMHRLTLLPGEASSPCLWPRIRQFIHISDPSCRPRLATEFLTKQQLLEEVDRLQEELAGSEDAVVFCHNDVLLANVVIQEDNVNFIDLEYGAANYAAYDIANHFVEFVGCEGELDYLAWLPGRDWQMDWIREYLGGGQGVAEQQVEALQGQVEKYMLAAHLLWGVWAVIQAQNSTIEFDFEDYAIQRLKEFRRWRGVLKTREAKL